MYQPRFKKRRVTKCLDELTIIRDGEHFGTNDSNNYSYREIAQDFAQCSSIHGVKYVGSFDAKSTKFEKVVWICALIFGLTGAGMMVERFWVRYNDNPTRTMIDTSFAPSWDVAFPAVTICSLTPPRLRIRLGLLKKMKLPGDMDIEQAASVLEHASDTVQAHEPEEEIYTSIENILELNNQSFTDLINQLHMPCEEMTKSCWWEGREVICKDILRSTYSANGLCCSFNYLLQEQLNAESTEETLMPVHTVHFGRDSGLIMVFSEALFQNEYITTNTSETSNKYNTLGLAVMIHNSYDYPDVEAEQVLLQPSREVQLRIDTQSLTAAPEVLEMTDRRRGCISENMKTLEYFPTKYRLLNCRIDCRIRAALRICGCAPYFYDLRKTRAAFKVCGLRRSACLARHYKDVWYSMYDESNNYSKRCECPSQCQDVSFAIRTTECSVEQAQFATQPFYRNLTGSEAILRVTLSSQVHTVMRKGSVADWINLLSSLGGIFSLFLGCSFLSLVEVFYFAGLLVRSAVVYKKKT